MLPASQDIKPIELGWKSPDEIAVFIGVSRRTVYNWLQAGKLRWRRVVGGPIRIDPSSIWEDDKGPRTPWEVDPVKSEACKKAYSKQLGRASAFRRRLGR